VARPSVRIKRVYEQSDPSDGYRVLVDRLWPRGLTKADAAYEEWIREAGPSDDLRRWFGHDPARFGEFADRYRAELEGSEALERLRAVCHEHPVVTLLYGAKDTEHNQAVVLRDLLA
jgi:DNA-3-methyladenine glycosylase